MYTTKDEEGHKIISLILSFKVSRQGQVTNFGLFEILDPELVRIDTKIKSVSCISNRKIKRSYKSKFDLDV